MPGHEWEETRNKLLTFRLFAYVDAELQFPADRLEPLPELTARALRLDNFRSIWAEEGVAHYYALHVPRPIKGLLSDAPNGGIPERTFVPMHAGMGTAFAEDVLSNLSADPTPGDLRDAVRRFFDLCRDNCSPGWYENTIEPLGLVVRTMYPRHLSQMSDAVGVIDREAQLLFWHGVGRSLYFVPTNFASFGASHTRALKAAIAEPPSLDDQRNAIAGLVWAITLVNLRQPSVLQNLLRAAEHLDRDDAVINGIVSALLVWHHMVPGDKAFLTPYTRTVSAADSPLWNRWVAGPVTAALKEALPTLADQRRVASLFAWRPVETLAHHHKAHHKAANHGGADQ